MSERMEKEGDCEKMVVNKDDSGVKWERGTERPVEAGGREWRPELMVVEGKEMAWELEGKERRGWKERPETVWELEAKEEEKEKEKRRGE